MDIVVSETSRITTIMNYKLFAFASFYSRIVLKKLSSVQLKAFRKVERSNKGYLKSLADIKFTIQFLLENLCGSQDKWLKEELILDTTKT